MAFLNSHKRRRFQVFLQIHELNSVPYVSGILFVKIRLLDGGNYVYVSHSCNVVDHKVVWNDSVDFECKISGCAQTGLLDFCRMRVSVRKEAKGGKSYSKVGYVDVNLTEFADTGQVGRQRHYLLDGYSLTKRKVPSRSESSSDYETDVQEVFVDNLALNCGSSRPSDVAISVHPNDAVDNDVASTNDKSSGSTSVCGHKRNLSAFSFHSEGQSVSGSLLAAPLHTRNSSWESSALQYITRCSSSSSNLNERPLDLRLNQVDNNSLQSRIHSSRIDNEDVVMSLLRNHHLDILSSGQGVSNEGPSDRGSLCLSVARNGKALLIGATDSVLLDSALS